MKSINFSNNKSSNPGGRLRNTNKEQNKLYDCEEQILSFMYSVHTNYLFHNDCTSHFT